MFSTMHRSYSRGLNEPGKPSLLRLPCNIQKWLHVGRKDSEHYRSLPRRNRKQNNRIEVKHDISEGVSAQRSSGFIDPEIFNSDIEESDVVIIAGTAQGHFGASLAFKNGLTEKTDRRTSSELFINYESYIGAIIGGSFLLRGLVRVNACYKLYAAESLVTGMCCIARAYVISGSKGKARESRIKNLKRSATKPSYVASIDQNGMKWVFFTGPSEPSSVNEPSLDPLAWFGFKNYQHHFPSLSPDYSTPFIQQTALPQSYAECVKTVHVGTKNHAGKQERARDRQRRRRKEKRVAKAVARGGLATSEDSSTGTTPSRARLEALTKDLTDVKESWDPTGSSILLHKKQLSTRNGVEQVKEEHSSQDSQAATRGTQDLLRKHCPESPLKSLFNSETLDFHPFDYYIHRSLYGSTAYDKDYAHHAKEWQRLLLGVSRNGGGFLGLTRNLGK